MAAPSAPNVLVTGSTGHLGHALVATLPLHGFRPLGIDILPSSSTHLTGSISDRGFLAGIFATYPSIKHVLHAATLHKPHVGTHTKADFIDTNVTGTLALFEEAIASGLKSGSTLESFVYISTTSAFGGALSPKKGNPAAWIDESVASVVKNVYGGTKCAAEDMCALMAKESGVGTVVLRTSRFFPEQDDDEERRAEVPSDENLKVLELIYRRVDIEDVVSACICAMTKAKEVRFGKYIISAPTIFPKNANLLAALHDGRAEEVVKECMKRIEPGLDVGEVFAGLGWKFLANIDRVYDSGKAVRELGWMPKWTFPEAVARLKRGERWKSELTDVIGKKGYHALPTGVYTT